MNTADLELIRRMIADNYGEINRRLEPLEALLGLSEPWQSAASTLESIEYRLQALENREASAVEVIPEPTVDAIEDAVERIEDAAENAEIAAETAVEAAAEAETAALEAAAVVEETPGAVDGDTPPGETPVVEETPGVVNEILNDDAPSTDAPRRGSWWRREILTPRSS